MMRALGLLLTVLVMAGCGSASWVFSSNTSGPNPGTTFVVVWVSDSPVDDAEALEVSVARAEVVGADGAELLSDEIGTFDLLRLQNGARAKLAEAAIPVGRYARLRLTLVTEGPRAPRMLVAGRWVPLGFVSPTAHVVEIPYPFEAPDQGRVEIQVDFNARLSVLDRGGDLALDPVLDALDPEAAGSITGRVTGPLGAGMADAVVVARRRGLEVRSTRSRADGTYTLTPLAPGIYEVVVEGRQGSLGTRPDIEVTAGASTRVDLGTS